MAGTSKLFSTMMKAWQIGSPSIASPIYLAREPIPMQCCLCIGQLKFTENWSHAPFAFSEIVFA
jgi:hypothetical protein